MDPWRTWLKEVLVANQVAGDLRRHVASLSWPAPVSTPAARRYGIGAQVLRSRLMASKWSLGIGPLVPGTAPRGRRMVQVVASLQGMARHPVWRKRIGVERDRGTSAGQIRWTGRRPSIGAGKRTYP